MKVDKEIYEDIKYKSEMEPMFFGSVSELREKAIKSIVEYRLAKNAIQMFYEKRKVYEDFLKQLEPIEPKTTGNQDHTNPSS